MFTTKGAVVATTCTLAAGIFGIYLLARKGKKKEVDLKKLLKIFEGVVQAMEQAGLSVAEKEKRIRQNSRQQNKHVSDDEMYQFCYDEFMNDIKQREEAIYKKFKTTESACKKAARKHGSNAEFQTLVKRMNQIASMFERKEAEVPDWFTESKMIALMRDLMEETSQAMEDCVQELSSRGCTKNHPQFQSVVQVLFQQKNPQAVSRYAREAWHHKGDYGCRYVQISGECSFAQSHRGAFDRAKEKNGRSRHRLVKGSGEVRVRELR